MFKLYPKNLTFYSMHTFCLVMYLVFDHVSFVTTNEHILFHKNTILHLFLLHHFCEAGPSALYLQREITCQVCL